MDFRVSQTLNMKSGIWIYIKMDVDKLGTTVTREEAERRLQNVQNETLCKVNGLTALAEQPSAFILCPLVGDFININFNGSEFIC